MSTPVRPRLTGDRNQCPGCGELFNSTFAFDKHRVGKYQNNGRSCLSAEGMSAIGMFKREDGFWIGSKMPEEVAAIKAK